MNQVLMLITTLTVLCLAPIPNGEVLASPPGADDINWQILLDYDDAGFGLLRAEVMPPLRKDVGSPGLSSALLRLPCEVIWLNGAGAPLRSTQVELPLGNPGGCDPTRETRHGGGIPDQGTILLRLAGPPAHLVAAIRLRPVAERCGFDLPPAFTATERPLPLPDSGGRAGEALIGWEKVFDNGPDDNRLVVAVLSEGYTAADIADGAFVEDVEQYVLRHFRDFEPWDDLANAMNVYRIDVESAERGIDNEPCGTFVDTYFNSLFVDCGFLMQLAGDGDARVYDLADQVIGPGVWDRVIVLINTSTYSAWGGQPLLMTVDNPLAEAGVFIHEFGHAFNGLGDEYGGNCSWPWWPTPNISQTPDIDDIPWAHWIEPGTPLPTPDTSTYEGVVGAFLGGHFCDSQYYRPWRQCLMRYVPDDFCPVCEEAITVTLLNSLDLVDSVSPPGDVNYPLDLIGRTFSLNTPAIDHLTFRWYLNGRLLADQVEPDCLITAGDLLALGLDECPLLAVVGYDSEDVRRNIPSEAHGWQVSVDYTATAVADPQIEFQFELGLPSPNPAIDGMGIRFSLERSGQIDLAVFDIRGRRVRSLIAGRQGAGDRSLEWDGRDDTGVRVAGGVYLVRLSTELGSATRRVVLLR